MKVLFDIDDTLYDRALPFMQALQDFEKKFPAKWYEEEAMRTLYAAVIKRGDEVFEASEKGDISMDESFIYKYTKGFGDCGLNLTDEEALAFQNVYLNAQHSLRPDESVLNLIKSIHERGHEIGILTNGPGEHQRRKLKNLGVMPYLTEELIVISGEVGCCKPDPRIFEIVRKACNTADSTIMMIGDSYEKDILPAMNCNMKTVWIDRAKNETLTCAKVISRINKGLE